MKAITLWPEWAYAITQLGKRVENRTWHPPRSLVGQRFAIHAGASIGGRKGRVALSEAIDSVTMTAQSCGWEHEWNTDDGELIDSASLWRGEEQAFLDAFIPTSAIVCTAVLDRVECDKWHDDTPPWGVMGSVWWMLRDVVVFETPLPMKGKLGLWDAEVPHGN